MPADLLAKALPVPTGFSMRSADRNPECMQNLATSSRLRFLHLEGSYKQLPALPSQLEELKFTCGDTTEIGLSPSALTSLKTLNLQPELHWVLSGGLARPGSPQVSEGPVRVEYSRFLDDWSSLASLTAHTNLCFVKFKPPANVEAISGLTQLHDLSITIPSNCNNEGYDWEDWQQRLSSTLACLVGLCKLSLVGPQLDSLEWCSAVTNLRSLCVGGAFNSLESLRNCPR